jgi:hypothetical protein
VLTWDVKRGQKKAEKDKEASREGLYFSTTFPHDFFKQNIQGRLNLEMDGCLQIVDNFKR